MSRNPSPASEAAEARRYRRGSNLEVIWGRYLKPYTLFPLIGVLAFFMLYPLFMVVYGSFKGGPPGGTDLPFTADGYVRAFTDWMTIKALITTLALAVPRTILGMSLAIFLAWIVTRTNTPKVLLLEQLVWFRYFLPYLPLTLAWVMFAGGRASFLNRWAMDTFNLSAPPLDIRSYWGIILLSVLSMGSVFYLFLAPAFRNMDASLEESARISGASSLTTLRRITAPLLTPAILGATFLAFLYTVESFETELLLGSQKGIYVVTTFIWQSMNKTPADHPAAMALSSAFMFAVAGIIILQFKIWGGRSFVTVTGRGFGQRPTDLGPWRWATFGFVIGYFLLASMLPLAILMMGTFQGTWGIGESGWTLRHWERAFGDPGLIRTLKNTLLLAVGSATGKVILYGLLSYCFLRTKLAGRQAIEALTWIPRAAPGIVMAVAFVWAFLGGFPPFKVLYGTLILMAMVIVIEGTPSGMRVMNGGMVQIGAELEESARVSGASWLRTVWRVIVPLLAPTIIVVWLRGFLAGVRALVLILFIYVPASKTLAVDIFELWASNEWEQAAVLGVMLTAITVVAAIVAQYVGARQRRVFEQVGV